MTSEARTAFVWVWLPGATEPVPAGRLEHHEGTDIITFAYGKSYLAREDARPLYRPELPLRRGRQEPRGSLKVAGVIRDGGPDAWGQRVILRRLLGKRNVRDEDPGSVSLLTYLLASGSNRPGALDFQASAETCVERTHNATLEELQQGALDMESGTPMSRELLDALEAGSSVGGARPKATLAHGDRHLIAKFSSLTDNYPVMKAEAAAMGLARRVGLDVAKTELVQVAGRDVLLVERFDRGPGGTRRAFVSALTIAMESEMNARYATYTGLADALRERSATRRETLKELFSRIVFNILVSNTDDHARNHAAFVDGEGELELTPAYDICPQNRTGQEAAQAMAFGPDGERLSQVAECLRVARFYDLSGREARDIIDGQMAVIRTQWNEAAEEAALTGPERDQMWGTQILNPFATYGYREG
jgi:serine/threonine-protein kinase HipA